MNAPPAPKGPNPKHAPLSKGFHAGKNRQLKEAQATLMIMKRVTGSTIREISEDFGCGIDTVHSRIELGQQMDLLTQYRDQMISELVPLAVQAFKDLLSRGHYRAAADILHGFGIIPKAGSSQTVIKQEISLDEWRSARNDAISADQNTVSVLPPQPAQAPSPPALPIDGQDVAPGPEEAETPLPPLD